MLFEVVYSGVNGLACGVGLTRKGISFMLTLIRLWNEEVGND